MSADTQYFTKLDKIEDFSKNFTKKLKPGLVIGLSGQLGSGKTTFVRNIMNNLGFKSKVTSPSFSLINRYKLDKKKIKYVYHIDLYRLGDQGMLPDLGIEDILQDNESIVFIEWPDILEDFIDKSRYIKIFFE